MTLSVNGNPQEYVGDGTDATLGTVFFFNTSSDVIVTQRTIASGVDVTMVEGTDYEVSGGSAAGAVGDVEIKAGVGAVKYTALVHWIISRAIPLTQTLDYLENDGFPAASHESGLDRFTMHSQDNAAKANLALHFPIGDGASLTSELPDSVTRALKVASFDANGNVTVATPTTVGYGKVLLDSVSTSDTTITLDATDWPATYDRVEIEIVRMRPNVDGALSIEPIDGGSAVSASLHNSIAPLVDTTHTPTTATNWTMPGNNNTAVAQVAGSLIVTNVEGALQGTGMFTYQSTAVVYGGFHMYIHRYVVASTSWDGFSFTHAGGTFSLVARLWGFPKV